MTERVPIQTLFVHKRTFWPDGGAVCKVKGSAILELHTWKSLALGVLIGIRKRKKKKRMDGCKKYAASIGETEVVQS